jgi:putative copper resistance protein D
MIRSFSLTGWSREPVLMVPLVLERWAHIFSSSLLVSLLAFEHFYVTPVLRGHSLENRLVTESRKYFGALTWICWSVGSVSGALWLLTIVASITGSGLNFASVREVLGVTQFGHLWLWRSVLSLTLAVGLLLGGLRKTHVTQTLWIGLAGLNLGSLAWAGHAGAAIGSFAPIHLLTDVAHLVISAIWPGSLLPLAVWLFVTARARGCEILPVINAVLERFSAISLAAIALLGASGVLNSVFMVKRLSDLYTTSYGQILAAKIILFLIMIGLGAQNRWLLKAQRHRDRNQPASDRTKAKRLFRNICLESALTFVVFGLVGVLGAIPPPSI